MIWAIKDNKRIRASPKEKANCPICNKELIAKCGTIKIWHWAHQSNKECDIWYEHESNWHINWKNEFPKEQQEILIKKENKYHIADIKTKTGKIIELQASPISLIEIKEREEFYGENMIWLLNGQTIGKNFELKKKYFIWKWLPAIAKYSSREIFIDEKKRGIIKIRVFKYKYMKQDGEGVVYSKKQFLEIYGDIFKKDGEIQKRETG